MVLGAPGGGGAKPDKAGHKGITRKCGAGQNMKCTLGTSERKGAARESGRRMRRERRRASRESGEQGCG